jgi:hypothetical protein
LTPGTTKKNACALLYVDDALVVHHDATKVLRQLDKYFKMKPGSIGDPKFYLGAKLLRPVTLSDGVEAWAMSPSKYLQGAIDNVKTYLRKYGERHLPKCAATPLPSNYRPEMDVTPELNPETASYYIKLGRVDIITEVSMLALHLAMPREGHMDAMFHMYAYLEKKHNSRMIFDPRYPLIDTTKFLECNWTEW